MKWKLGLAAADITPPVGVEMSGFVAREFGAIGTHDPLEAKVMVLQPEQGDPWVGVCLDLIGLEDALNQRIRAEVARVCGVDWASHLTLSTTHTHGGPAILHSAWLGEVDAGYVDFLVEQIACAVQRATERLESARLKVGRVSEPLVARNRRDLQGPVDPELGVLRLESVQGEVRAVLAVYACHPTVLGPTNYLYSADYPGVVRQVLQQVYPGSMAFFMTGCAGQINVGHDSQASIAGRGFAKRNYAEVERIGRIVGAAAVRAAETATPVSGAVRFTQIELELPFQPKPGEVERNQLKAQLLQKRQAALSGYAGSLRMLDAMLEWLEQNPSRPEQPSMPCTVQAYSLGEGCGMVFLPGESFVEIGLDIKAQFPQSKLLVASYCNQVVGYIPYPTAYPQGGYEVEESHMLFNLPSRYQPEASVHLARSAAQLLGSVWGQG